ncbi:hypothetical protein Q5H91_07335 [Sphingomonas sp. KR1UV-12]|uniref:DUF2783 domain-containing protein n=1 Tax=Sphingomonas aurea TaxID=3063994 RepID=A0ABT9EJB2_9SPHN|nr:hypothetical protein [Sphingomonas sp. KR1UV-12]MDP1027019.1 hypothetical protein [Sphingomonas sp. KR1UV-12]
MTDELPSKLDQAVKLLVQALALADENNCPLVAAHIEMAIEAAREKNGEA